MPFDGKDGQEPFPYIPGPEGLRMLARALRAPMPEGFGWDFGTKYQNDECGTVGCAMGLAKTLWFESRPRRGSIMCRSQRHRFILLPRILAPMWLPVITPKSLPGYSNSTWYCWVWARMATRQACSRVAACTNTRKTRR